MYVTSERTRDLFEIGAERVGEFGGRNAAVWMRPLWDDLLGRPVGRPVAATAMPSPDAAARHIEKSRKEVARNSSHNTGHAGLARTGTCVWWLEEISPAAGSQEHDYTSRSRRRASSGCTSLQSGPPTAPRARSSSAAIRSGSAPSFSSTCRPDAITRPASAR